MQVQHGIESTSYLFRGPRTRAGTSPCGRQSRSRAELAKEKKGKKRGEEDTKVLFQALQVRVPGPVNRQGDETAWLTLIWAFS